MSNTYDVKASELIKTVAEKLKPMIKKPEYVDLVKSGAGRERPPQDPDFWYIRAASILRQVYINGPIGVSKLRTHYGKRQEHVVHKKHHIKAGGSIISDALKELERAKLVKRTNTGRVITAQGQSLLDKSSKELKSEVKSDGSNA
ncbi:MAG: 30S ribosomal protein S19e [Candidatus Marsarchaeota archaeon]|jgi:small subunit ribosomal protein S19e|nr:30S ribosomal protein S19e [Candidatus Marsarchaeota archaeon]MCL5418889.1 30S ribosomal protein S19e [Candidatus Marsarchaeota archaeon]